MKLVRFGLIVTGRGEADFLPRLSRAIMAATHCTFEVIRKSEQLNPVTSPKRILAMVGRGRRIPTIDEEQFGLPALAFLRAYQNAFVLVIDDLESARQPQAPQVFDRYRTALNMVLDGPGLSARAAVHFFVNMLEAYYFAHATVVNRVARFDVLPDDHPDDGEAIPHPKNRLKTIWSAFDEIDHGKDIIGALDLHYVLDRPRHCCWLRTMVAWCIDRLHDCDAIWNPGIHHAFQLPNGCRSELTAKQ